MNLPDQGLPDWQKIIRTDGFTILPGYGIEKLFFAIPTTADLARKQDGNPSFFLEFVSDQNNPIPAESLYAMLSMELEQTGDFESAYRFVAQQQSGTRLLPVAFSTETYFHLECGDSHETSPFAWNGKRASVYSRISTLSARLLYATLRSGGGALAKAAIECSPVAFLPRVELKVECEPAQVIQALKATARQESSIAFQSVTRFLQSPPPELFRIEGEDRGEEGQLGLALAGRLIHFFARSAPCPRISDGPHIGFGNGPEAPSGTAGWDLRTPLLCQIPIFLNYDPFTPIRGSTLESITGFTRVPLLPDQMRTRTVTVGWNLLQNIQDCCSVQIALRVDRSFSETGLPSVQYVDLYPTDKTSMTIPLKFAKIGTSQPFEAKISVVRSADVQETDWFPGDDYVFIDGSCLPGRCITVNGSEGLLAEASLSAVIVDENDRPIATATLNQAVPVATFLVQSLSPSARMRVTATDRNLSSNQVSVDLPVYSVMVERASFPGYGPQTVPLSLKFYDDVALVRLALAPEKSSADPIVLEFSPKATSGILSYFATSLFHNRYQFRVTQLNAETEENPWSDYQMPGQSLCLSIYKDHVRQESVLNG